MPFTQNDHYLQTCKDKWLARYKDARAGKAHGMLNQPEGAPPAKKQSECTFVIETFVLTVNLHRRGYNWAPARRHRYHQFSLERYSIAIQLRPHRARDWVGKHNVFGPQLLRRTGIYNDISASTGCQGHTSRTIRRS
jgi:hypothetical protein